MGNVLGYLDYGLDLTTLSQSNLLKLDRVQNEAVRVILGTTKDTPIEAMCYLPDLPSMETGHKMEQIKAYLSAMQNPKNPLHDAVREEKGCIHGKRQVMDGPSRTINPACVWSRRAEANKGLGEMSS